MASLAQCAKPLLAFACIGPCPTRHVSTLFATNRPVVTSLYVLARRLIRNRRGEFGVAHADLRASPQAVALHEHYSIP